MENEKKNNGTLVGILIGLVIALIIGVCLFATGTIGFKTNTTVDNEQSSGNNQSTTTDNQQNNEDYDAEAIAKEKMPTVLSFIKQESGVYTYCGNKGSSDITKGNYYYSISKSYKTLNELKNQLNSVMTKEIYNKYFLNDNDKYIEQDGNLYCAYLGADGLVIHFSSEDSINKLDNLTYSISNKTTNSFDATLSFTYSSEIEGVTNKEYKYTSSFIKENDTWLVNSFEEK